MLVGVRQRLRERQLEGDARAGVWARDEARRLQWQFVRRQWRHVCGLVLAVGVITAIVLVFIDDSFQCGFIVGAALVGTFAAIAVVVMQVTGTAPTSMGAIAEQWTASELRPLRRAGWRIVHHFALRKSDIDHVLLGPSGVFAVETKWSGRGWMLDPLEYRVLQAVKRVRGSATLLQLRHPLRSLGVGTVASVSLRRASRAA